MSRVPVAVAADDGSVIERSWREPERFAELFDRHAPAVHRYLARRLGEQAAGDVLAETFLAAFRRRERYDTSRADARPWLYGIATNLVGQHRREEARRYRLLRALAPEPDVEFPADGVADRVTAAAARRALVDGLAGLAPADRDVLLLVAEGQLTYDEVATALDIPVGTVRSRLHRARRQVRAALGDTDPTDPEESR